MPDYTPNFNLAEFDFGDTLDAPTSVQAEVQRFTTIDRQLFAMFNVFGDGVINGWNVTDGGNLQVSISNGVGIITSFAVESDFSTVLSGLPANSTCYIYVQIDNTTITDRIPEFIFSVTPINGGNLLLATVVTGATAIVSIDTTVVVKIGFQQIITALIAVHRHNGIIAPKIDLTDEVQGQLPMDHMADIDASQIVGGRLPISVLPQIDHTTLANIGTLTHPQLDSFAQSIQLDNVALFGEVTTINLLKIITALKYQNASVDKFLENQLFFIPGITDDTWIDWINTTANVTYGCISGIPALSEEIGNIQELDEYGSSDNLAIVTIPWTTDQDFELASSISNLVINDGVSITTDATAANPVETFDTGIAGQVVSYFVPNLTDTNTTQVTYESPAAQGSLAGLFSTANTRSVLFTKTFPQPANWSNYDTLNVYVKSVSATHDAVSLVIYDPQNNKLASFPLLAQDETTTFGNQATNGFALKKFSIIGFPRTNIGSIALSIQSITSSTESFSVDTIYLTSSKTLLPQGEITFRYNTTSAVIFSSVEYDATIPAGTELRVRVRTGNTLEELANATYSSLLSSGQAISTVATYIEIDIVFLSDSTMQLSPLLTALYLSLLVPSEDSGLTISTLEDWEQGVSENIAISADGVVSMAEENIGDFYFINGLAVNELGPNLQPVVGISSNNMPVAPYQGYAAINPAAQVPDEYNPGREFLRGLFNPKSAIRLETGDFLIADTGNDRILEMTQQGEFVRGFASHNAILDTTLYALTSNYNPRLGVLFITFSMELDIKYADLTQITININGTPVQLSNSLDEVRDPKTGVVIERPDLAAFLAGTGGNFSGQTDNLLSIILSPDKVALLANATTQTVTVSLIGNPNPTSSVVVQLNGVTGIECFIGDYMYFGQGGIWAPICAKETTSDRNVVVNAVVNGDSENLAPSGIVSIIEFEKDIGNISNGQTLGTTFSYSATVFSDILLGSVSYFEVAGSAGGTERKLLVAGMQMTSNNFLTSSSSSGGGVSGTSQPILLGLTELQKFSQFSGIVSIVDMTSTLPSFSYFSPDGMFPSDAFFDDEGNIVVAESGLLAQTGRIITLDSTGTIIKLVGDGMYTQINAIRGLPEDHVFVST